VKHSDEALASSIGFAAVAVTDAFAGFNLAIHTGLV
jgi:hypothetical protein